MPAPRDFELLGVRPSASPEEIRQAYLDLVRVWHPDRFSSDARLRAVAGEKLKAINEAYRNLERPGEATSESTAGSPASPSFDAGIPKGPNPAPASAPATIAGKLEISFGWRPVAAGALFVLGLGGGLMIVRWLREPVNLRNQMNAAALRQASRNRPGLSAMAAGWDGALPRGAERLFPEGVPLVRRPVRIAEPRRAEAPVVSYRNGQHLSEPRGASGAGELRVRNQTASSAIVSVVVAGNQGSAVREVYIAPADDVVIGGLPPGVYDASVRFGDPRGKLSPAKSIGRYSFLQVQSARELQADRYEVTLRAGQAVRE